MSGEAGKGHKQRPRVEVYCTEDQFRENWDRAINPKPVIHEHDDPGDENDYKADSV